MAYEITDPRPPPTEGQQREIRLLELLQRVWTYAFTTKSDTARVYADEIAEASSRGFLTSQVVPGRVLFGRLWKITSPGILWLETNSALIADSEVAKYAELCDAA